MTSSKPIQEAQFDGRPAVFVNVFRVGNETPQGVSQAVRGYLDELRRELPDEVAISIWEDNSEVYKARMSLLTKKCHDRFDVGVVTFRILPRDSTCVLGYSRNSDFSARLFPVFSFNWCEYQHDLTVCVHRDVGNYC